MIAYGIAELPLIQKLQEYHPRVTKPWYADDAGAGGNYWQILARFWELQVRGPLRGYFSEPTKSILVVAPRTVARAKEFF